MVVCTCGVGVLLQLCTVFFVVVVDVVGSVVRTVVGSVVRTVVGSVACGCPWVVLIFVVACEMAVFPSYPFVDLFLVSL